LEIENLRRIPRIFDKKTLILGVIQDSYINFKRFIGISFPLSWSC